VLWLFKQIHHLQHDHAQACLHEVVSCPVPLALLLLRTGNGNALVDSSTGVTLRTASGSLSAPYTLLDAIVSPGRMSMNSHGLARESEYEQPGAGHSS
jgi:hypothetical protein